jgi:ActR/RegA family two-component response regulator
MPWRRFSTFRANLGLECGRMAHHLLDGRCNDNELVGRWTWVMVTSSDKSVLILSGERRSRMALGHLLQQYGTCVHCFTRRKDCLAGLSKNPCDLLIVDCDGDAADGLRVLAEVRRISPPSSSLVLVEPGDTATAVEAMKLGATNCIEKPIQMEHLLSVIEADPSGMRPCVAGCGPPLTKAEMRVLRLGHSGQDKQGHRGHPAPLPKDRRGASPQHHSQTGCLRHRGSCQVGGRHRAYSRRKRGPVDGICPTVQAIDA